MPRSKRSTDNKVAARFSTVVPGLDRAGSFSSPSSCRASTEGGASPAPNGGAPTSCIVPSSCNRTSFSIPALGFCSTGSFSAPSSSTSRKAELASSTHQPAASPGNTLGLFCSRVLLVRHFSVNSFPKHPIGQISSKFQRADVHQVLLEQYYAAPCHSVSCGVPSLTMSRSQP